MLADFVEDLKRKIQTVIAPKPENPDDPDAPLRPGGSPIETPPPNQPFLHRRPTRAITPRSAASHSFVSPSRCGAKKRPPLTPDAAMRKPPLSALCPLRALRF